MPNTVSPVPFRGNGLSCQTVAALNAFCPTYTYVDALHFEALTGVPFGTRSLRADPNRLIMPFIDPDIGLDHALACLGAEVETRWFDESDVQPAIDVLSQWLLVGPVLLGPMSMGALGYLPFSTLYRACDHYIVARKLDAEGLWVVDGEGFCPALLSLDELTHSWQAEDIPEGRGAFTLRRARAPVNRDLDWSMVRRGLALARTLLLDSTSHDGAMHLRALAESESDLLAWPAARRGLEFQISFKAQRNMAAIAFLQKALTFDPSRTTAGILAAVVGALELQAVALGECAPGLLVREPGCLTPLREVARQESVLGSLFGRLEIA